MKKYATLLVAGTIATTAAAYAGSVVNDGVGLQQTGGNSGFMNVANDSLPMLSAGTQELGVGGSLDLEDGVAWDLNLTYGWFLRDNWEVGFSIDWAGEDGDILRDSRFGLFTEYNFATGTKWVPYIGAGVSYAASGDKFDSVNNQEIGGEDGFAFSGELGVKYFFRSHMAVYGGVNFSWSPDDVFGVADEISDNLTQIEIGMRFYF
ncbi:outer membrane beta-barrel protein [Roseibacillus ishigakijimensis]|uniref:Outer membrane beta-barrel protein n=1 Tax=Roseibacillus ishigakijimensis TaxID=454146 RepID=A0A934VJK0_9BACT|nr:outer membrane beta-barrel protein [Roseibacillus ishigakijimensis]MBK1832684.1 outer membrane beta-barrel protein [Roseibacillus ishigakijimensis]